jgi:hypothetical protein
VLCRRVVVVVVDELAGDRTCENGRCSWALAVTAHKAARRRAAVRIVVEGKGAKRKTKTSRIA